ncbi:TetR/AcrR family transcriptional regulator [Mycolicibacterium komossense]|uniref:TetR/AcrR family transcriptional regulator n=1 Tax=Mycolicibacterium komossense TaxID=1779 RepID=A0ABT3CH85_9MYCO|nr:TetR/AcrR family transcriptional regulator [Mycolicibacterium komossense]MCV7228799.1 TetR/AcrR family transcriptional regulator [Mycolicibacterium komossense]
MDVDNAQRTSPTEPAGARQLVSPRSEATREHIIRAARDAFCTLGYESTTFKEIAARARVSRPTVNYHFANKIALYRTLENDAVTTVLAETIEQSSGQEQAFLAALHAFATKLVSAESENRTRADFLITAVLESARRAELQAVGSTATAALRQHLGDLVTAAMHRGELPAETDLAAMVEFALATLLGMGLCAPTRHRLSTAGSSSSARHRRTPRLSEQPRRRTA